MESQNNIHVIDSLRAFDSKGAQDILDYMESEGADNSERDSYGRYTELTPSKESTHDNFILPTKYNNMGVEEMLAIFEARAKKPTLLERLINIFK